MAARARTRAVAIPRLLEVVDLDVAVEKRPGDEVRHAVIRVLARVDLPEKVPLLVVGEIAQADRDGVDVVGRDVLAERECGGNRRLRRADRRPHLVAALEDVEIRRLRAEDLLVDRRRRSLSRSRSRRRSTCPGSSSRPWPIARRRCRSSTQSPRPSPSPSPVRRRCGPRAACCRSCRRSPAHWRASARRGRAAFLRPRPTRTALRSTASRTRACGRRLFPFRRRRSHGI